jgi:hypothetical protein
MSNVTRTSSNQLSQNALHGAAPGNATAATVIPAASLQRSNIQFFLRSIAEGPRHK